MAIDKSTPSQTAGARNAGLPTELVGLRPAGNFSFDELYRLAQVCHKSGLFEDITDASQAMVKIVKGQELGFHPTSALAAFHIIRKQLFIKSWAIAALINTCGYGGYKISEQTPERCTITFRRKYHDEGWVILPLVTYTIAEAKLHNLVERSNHWKVSPAHMLYQRAMGRGGSMYFPELLAGLTAPQDETPISEAHHQENIVDLFGDDLRGSTLHASPAIDVETGELPEQFDEQERGLQNSDQPDANQWYPSPSAWRDTLEAHQDASKLTEGLRTKVKLALNPESKTTDTQGLALAGAVLDCLNAQEQ